MKTEFEPTHIIATGTRVLPVRLEPSEDHGGSVLYTQEEWESVTSADWELQDDGRLTFQGRNPRPVVATLHMIGDDIGGPHLATSED